MPDQTKIEWTDATWNVLRGCTRVSQGCVNCYAEGIAARFSNPGAPFHGLAKRTTGGPRWTGEIGFAEHLLDQPLRWKRPRRIFVNSMSDLFHEKVTDDQIDRIFAVMALCPQHTFQILTKRPERMRDYVTGPAVRRIVGLYQRRLLARASGEVRRIDAFDIACDKVGLVEEYPEAHIVPRLQDRGLKAGWPLPNVWLGVSIEDQATADARIPQLLAAPAAVRFLSIEPMLGPISLRCIPWTASDRGFVDALTGKTQHPETRARYPDRHPDVMGLDLVIVGGESGPHARPMHPAWARFLRDQCVAAGVPFFFKQWGEWMPVERLLPSQPGHVTVWPDGAVGPGNANRNGGSGWSVERIGKKAAGRLLDGREWNEMPGVADG